MITVDDVLATFPGSEDITPRDDDPSPVDCWHAEQHALMRAGIDEARRDVILRRDQHLGCHLKIGEAFQPRRKERDRTLLGCDTSGRRWCRGAVLMIDIVLGEKRREAVDVMRVQRCRKLVREVARARRRGRRNACNAQYGASADQA